MEVLITGGNGLLGRHVLAALQERGDAVRVLALPGEDTSALESRGVPVHRGDICLPGTLDEAIDGADALVAAVRSKAPGDHVTLTYMDASGSPETVQVTLGQAQA